jgi:hypothetical protein
MAVVATAAAKSVLRARAWSPRAGMFCSISAEAMTCGAGRPAQ